MSEALDSDAVERLLGRMAVARLGCHAADRTYVVPVAYAYRDGACYGHTSDGMKLRMLRRNPAVCVEVEQVESLARWESVIAWGRFEELSGQVARDAARFLAARLHEAATGSTAGPEAITATAEMMLGRGVIYRIPLAEKTGRVERGEVASAWFGARG